MKDRFCILKVLDPSSLELSTIRNVLRNEIYFEIDSLFVVKCSKQSNEVLYDKLDTEGINFIQFYINIKSGSDFFGPTLTNDEISRLEKIIIDD